jgi:hypothetical protein
MILKEFLGLQHRFRWGGLDGDDCMTFPASWALAAIGIDPAEGLRGTYRSKAEAHAILDRHGGPLAFMAGRLIRIGATRADEPEDGDIGLVRMLAEESMDDAEVTEVGAIRFGPLWAAITPSGVIGKRAEHIAAWRLPA